MKTQRKISYGTITSILIFGFSWFAIGYFGPLIIKPGANLGPLLGIFVTGPVGFVLHPAFLKDKNDGKLMSFHKTLIIN